MKVTYRKGKIRAWDADGHEIKGILHSTIYLTRDGLSEVGLFFDRVEVLLEDVNRAADGVRDEPGVKR